MAAVPALLPVVTAGVYVYGIAFPLNAFGMAGHTALVA